MRDVVFSEPVHIACMDMETTSAFAMDEDQAWSAVLRRDRGFDGRFVTGVMTTGIYCRPSCAARHPARGNVRFFPDGKAAQAAGLRACLRCKPDEMGRDEAAILRAVQFITAHSAIPSLAEVSVAVGYAPHHFQRIFKRSTGLSPTGYARVLRTKRAEAALATENSVTDAVYEAGYSAPSRFYAETKGRLGMAPSAWRKGGEGVTIRWTITSTSLGSMLIAATDQGICRLSFDEDEVELARRFPNAVIEPAGGTLRDLVAGAIAAVEDPANMGSLPLDVKGTAFQESIWRELSRIPAGETATYAALAARAGNSAAVRAAGSACGANPVAVLIPCHRAKRTDGSLGG
jgi:AraC family transcriptional regulator, regulatory protein of adaptative response / methylated-DNA-[protein]-cysteine methyltransferase